MRVPGSAHDGGNHIAEFSFKERGAPYPLRVMNAETPSEHNTSAFGPDSDQTSWRVKLSLRASHAAALPPNNEM